MISVPYGTPSKSIRYGRWVDFLPNIRPVSGAQITGSLTFDNTTLAALGLTPGAYDYAWGSAAAADSLQINIEPTSQSMPEPLSLAMFAAGLTTIGLIRRRRAR